MKHCLNCYRLIENNAEFCPFCGYGQDYEAKGKIAKYKKCPRCGAFLYNEAEGCQACGYRKKSGRNRIFITAACILIACMLAAAIFLLLSQR